MRRTFLKTLIGISLLPWAQIARASVLVKAARLWPSPDYSRITIELSDAVTFSQFDLKNPDRVVLDIEGIDADAILLDLAGKLTPTDPYIAALRIGHNRPGMTRLVVDLKTAVRAQVFTLKPLGEYGYRLVMDLYPQVPTMAKSTDPASTNAGSDTDSAKIAEPQQPGKSAYKRMVTVMIDPGHGGEDPGAIGANGNREKDVVLSIAHRLKAIIDKQENMRAVMTRDDDFFVPLGERVNKARAARADLFVSVHADAFITPNARGSSVFCLSEKGATSAAARWLAKSENAADLVGGVNLAVKDRVLREVIFDLQQTATIADSLKFGRAVLDEIGGINTLHRGEVEQASFAVLKAPDIPSILVETAFISNPEEEKRLIDNEYQDRMAHAIVAGLKQYMVKAAPVRPDRMT